MKYQIQILRKDKSSVYGSRASYICELAERAGAEIYDTNVANDSVTLNIEFSGAELHNAFIEAVRGMGEYDIVSSEVKMAPREKCSKLEVQEV